MLCCILLVCLFKPLPTRQHNQPLARRGARSATNNQVPKPAPKHKMLKKEALFNTKGTLVRASRAKRDRQDERATIKKDEGGALLFLKILPKPRHNNPEH